MNDKACIIEKITRGDEKAYIIYEDALLIAFLDHRPLFPGHTLLAPKEHYQTLDDLPDSILPHFFLQAKKINLAVQKGMGASGSFVAMNNKVSQSIPHLHLHLVPRNKGDGLKGFFWPRHPYEDEEEILSVQKKIKEQL